LEPPELDAGSPSYRDQERLGQYIAESVLGEVSGTATGSGGGTCTGDLPKDTYFAGSLIPSAEAELSGLSEDLQSKLSPTAIQVDFLLDPEIAAELSITVSGNVYYRSFPTYEEQFVNDPDYVPDAETDDGWEENSRQNGTFATVFRRLQFESEPIDVEIPAAEDLDDGETISAAVENAVLESLQDQLHDRLSSIDDSTTEPPVWRAPADSTALGEVIIGAGTGDEITIQLDRDDYSGDYQFPPDLFEDVPEDTRRALYDDLVNQLASAGRPFHPPWGMEVQAEFVDDEGGIRGTVTFENASNPSAGTNGYGSEYGADTYDTALFDLDLKLTLNRGEFLDFTFERLDEDFRYDRNLAGYGTNCTVNRIDESTLQTAYLPTYRQQRYVTRDPDSFDIPIDTSFETLAELDADGLETLRNLRNQMQSYLENRYEEYLEEYENSDEFREADRESFAADRETFKKEIERVERGIECLEWDLREGDGHIARAFELMNETFVSKVTDEDGEMEYEAWHLFQLAFILRVLPDIASREYDRWSDVEWRDEGEQSQNFDGSDLSALDIVDILWFPTGGGKTEAYLGLAIFNAFFDRKRGKKYGVTAWTRFPLRLLSLQQTQRIGELLMNAEQHRLQEPDINGADQFPFSLGYLVGSKNTPNKVSNYVGRSDAETEDYLREFLRYRGEGSDEAREEVKIFPSCPVCGGDVELRATDDLRLAHVCTADVADCAYQQRPRPSDNTYQIFADDELPIHIVDNELYRYAPTMIVGTIDKITAVGYERKSAHLYAGKMSHWCPEHGFASFDECTEKYGCHENYGGDNPNNASHLVPLKETPFGTPYDAAPGLQIQDELHLLEESLGTFNSHFETFVDKYQRYNGEQRTKIIGATATIEEYDEQARELYLRKAERFPCQGPALGENFYSTTKETTRRHFVGIMPHGKTHINAVIQLDYHYLREIEKVRSAAQNGTGTPRILHDLNFETVTSSDDLLELLSKYETALTYTISKRDKNRYTQSMRGQIAGYLREDGLREPNLAELTGDTPFDEVEDILGNLENPPEDYTARYNTIAATNMISHGVDVDRFNHMLFFGMPRQTAEYIQSSSRSGRTFPGTVFVCFNPARERDQSHYHLFEKYHEFLDRLVEPVPINRWSHFSVKRTLPSMIFGWMLNQWMYETGERLFFADQASELIRALQSGRGHSKDVSISGSGEFQDLLEASYGKDLVGELPEAFCGILDRERDRAFTNLENIQTDFASEGLSPGPMTSLRDIDEQVPFEPVDSDNEKLFKSLNSQ
jgi:hypothetical protein